MDYWRDKMVSNQKYKPFNVGDIFFITNGKGITRQEIKDHPGELAAIQSAATNNGIMGFIDIKTDFVIKLPATVFGKPDYEFMSKYIKSLSFSKKLVQQDNNFCD